MKQNYRILIIDDAFFLRNLIKKAIASKPQDDDLNYKFEIAGEAVNGEEGLELYKTCKPDIVTVDINMPKLNGLDFIQKLKAIYPYAKIIVISSNLKTEFEEKALNAGAFTYIQKPFQNSYLWSRLDEIAKKIMDENKEFDVAKFTSANNISDIFRPSIETKPSVEKEQKITTVKNSKLTVEPKPAVKQHTEKPKSTSNKVNVKKEVKNNININSEKKNRNKKNSKSEKPIIQANDLFANIVASEPKDEVFVNKNKKTSHTKHTKHNKPIKDVADKEIVNINDLFSTVTTTSNNNITKENNGNSKNINNKNDIKSSSKDSNTIDKKDNVKNSNKNKPINSEFVDKVVDNDIQGEEIDKIIEIPTENTLKIENIKVETNDKEEDLTIENNDSNIIEKTPVDNDEIIIEDNNEIIIEDNEEIVNSVKIPNEEAIFNDDIISNINEDEEVSNIETNDNEIIIEDDEIIIEDDEIIIEDDIDSLDDEIIIEDEIINNDNNDFDSNFIIIDNEDIENNSDFVSTDDEIIIEDDTLENEDNSTAMNNEIDKVDNDTSNGIDSNSEFNDIENDNFININISKDDTEKIENITDTTQYLYENIAYNFDDYVRPLSAFINKKDEDNDNKDKEENDIESADINKIDTSETIKDEDNTSIHIDSRNPFSNLDSEVFLFNDDNTIKIDEDKAEKDTKNNSTSIVHENTYKSNINNVSYNQIKNDQEPIITPPKNPKIKEIYGDKLKNEYNIKFDKVETTVEEPKPEKKLGFFARLFGRKKNKK